jgi:hypothetical protein
MSKQGVTPVGFAKADSGESIAMYMEGMRVAWPVYKPGRAGSIIEVARIKGKIFNTMKEAEAQGLELAREWVDRKCLEP